MIRDTKESDTTAILAMLKASGQFDAGGLAYILSILKSHLAGPGDQIWLTADDDAPHGVAYCGPEPVAHGVWNLHMLWIDPDRHRQGTGRALIEAIEARLRARNARMLIVETSSLPDFGPARHLYEQTGFVLEAEVKDFFAEGDNKLIFTKRLVPAAA